MATYVIYRHGSNSANQSMCDKAVVGLLEAKSKKDALARAEQELHLTVYNNQYLSAVAWSKAQAGDREAAEDLDSIESALLKPNEVGCIVCGKPPDKSMTLREAAFWACDKHSGGEQDDNA